MDARRLKRHAWVIAYVIMFIANMIILYQYRVLNDDFKDSLTETCEVRQSARDAYRHIIFEISHGHPLGEEIREYTEEHLPPVEC